LGREERLGVLRVKDVLGALLQKLEAGAGLDWDPVFVLNPLFLDLGAINSKHFFFKLGESVIYM